MLNQKRDVNKVKTAVPVELELNRNYEAVDYAQPVKATKKSNPWIDHIKKFSVDNGLTYNKSMLDPRLKESYVKSTGTKGKVSLGWDIKKSQDANGISRYKKIWRYKKNLKI